MDKDIKQIVKDKYTEVVTTRSSCCGPSCCSPEDSFSFIGEKYDELPGYIPEADYNLGCGIPTGAAQIKPGDTVLDLGSGAGNDVFVARSLTGETGLVIGVDMTEAMITRANENKRRLGFENVEFRLGDIEDLPVEDNSVDVAISNCVLNLTPDKQRAYNELFRVLKPGGHFGISDVVLDGKLPTPLQEAAALYAGCVAGAMQREDYLAIITRAGFGGVKVVKEHRIELPDELLREYLNEEQLNAFHQTGTGIFSVTVYGEKG